MDKRLIDNLQHPVMRVLVNTEYQLNKALMDAGCHPEDVADIINAVKAAIMSSNAILPRSCKILRLY